MSDNEIYLQILKDLPTGDIPDSLTVIPEGKIDIEGGEAIYMDSEAGQMVVSSFNRRGNDMVVDYEHQTLSNGPAPAAGWIKKLRYIAGKGVLADISWTTRAIEYLKAREYRYFSPVLTVSGYGRKVADLFSVALTNSPRINHLPSIVASRKPENDQKTIDDTQRHVNRLLGIGDDVFFKYAHDPAKRVAAKSAVDAFLHAGDMVFAKYQNQPERWPGIIDDCQRRVNELMGVKEDDFIACRLKENKKDPTVDEMQRKVNELMGIDDATFRKYNK